MTENVNKIIYTRRIATKLIEMGNLPLTTTPNPSKPEFLCWVFANTPKLNKDLDTILSDRPARGLRRTTAAMDEATVIE